MIYLKLLDGKFNIVVLESGNLDELKAGHPAVSPNGEVMVAWTPDPAWLASAIRSTGGDMKLIGRAIDLASRRPQQPVRPHFEAEEHVLDGIAADPAVKKLVFVETELLIAAESMILLLSSCYPADRQDEGFKAKVVYVRSQLKALIAGGA